MKHMRMFVTIWIGLMVSYMIAPSIHASSTVPEDVQIYAKGQGLEEFKTLVLDDPAGYGYANEEEVKAVTLGPGFEVHLFDSDKFNHVSDSLIDVSKPTGQYDFIVQSKGVGKSFLSIERFEGEFRVVLAGGDASRLDRSLNTMSKSLSTDIDTLNPVLIKDGNIRYLVAKVDGKEVNLPDVPSEKKSLMGGMDNNQLWDSAKTINFLKEVQSQGADPNVDGTGGYPAIESHTSKNNYTGIAITSLVIALVGSTAVYIWARKKQNTK